jgi:hypothetical protein
VSARFFGVADDLIAGKPAPTVSVVHKKYMHDAKPCGSWLASDSNLTANIYVECADAIAGKPAPTGAALI